MGNSLCCSARKKQQRALARGVIGHAIGAGDDAAAFNRAFELNDLHSSIQAFVELLNSKQPIEAFDEPLHPWALDPTTVGSLACTQLAILASMADQKDDASVNIRIGEAGAVPTLVGFLRRSDEVDRVHSAVVALSFLTADCEENANAVIHAGGLELLVAHMDSPVAGMRVACSTILRNICVVNDDCKKQLVRLGGLKALVRQLSQEPDATLCHVDVQLEAILNLQEVIEDDNGKVIAEYGLEVKRLGAVAILEYLTQASDEEEVRSIAEVVLRALAEVQ